MPPLQVLSLPPQPLPSAGLQPTCGPPQPVFGSHSPGEWLGGQERSDGAISESFLLQPRGVPSQAPEAVSSGSLPGTASCVFGAAPLQHSQVSSLPPQFASLAFDPAWPMSGIHNPCQSLVGQGALEGATGNIFAGLLQAGGLPSQAPELASIGVIPRYAASSPSGVAPLNPCEPAAPLQHSQVSLLPPPSGSLAFGASLGGQGLSGGATAGPSGSPPQLGGPPSQAPAAASTGASPPSPTKGWDYDSNEWLEVVADFLEDPQAAATKYRSLQAPSIVNVDEAWLRKKHFNPLYQAGVQAAAGFRKVQIAFVCKFSGRAKEGRVGIRGLYSPCRQGFGLMSLTRMTI